MYKKFVTIWDIANNLLSKLRSKKRIPKILDLIEQFWEELQWNFLLWTDSIWVVKSLLENWENVYLYLETWRITRFSKLELKDILEQEKIEKKYNEYLEFIDKLWVYSWKIVIEDKKKAVILFEKVLEKIWDWRKIEQFQYVEYNWNKYVFMWFHIWKENWEFCWLIKSRKHQKEMIWNIDVNDLNFEIS